MGASKATFKNHRPGEEVCKELAESVVGNSQTPARGWGPPSPVAGAQAPCCPARKGGGQRTGGGWEGGTLPPEQLSGNLLTNSPNSPILILERVLETQGGRGTARRQWGQRSERGHVRERLGPPPPGRPPPREGHGKHEQGVKPHAGRRPRQQPRRSRAEAPVPLTLVQGVRGPESSGPGPAPGGT